MERYFNTEGLCQPNIHYMVDLSSRLKIIKDMIEKEKYFVINRGRQYGKTTILAAISDCFCDEYKIVSLDFQMLSSSVYSSENNFSLYFADMFVQSFEKLSELESNVVEKLNLAVKNKGTNFILTDLFVFLSSFCKVSSKPILLLMDEVDNASNNQIFIDFISLLRAYYLQRRLKPIFKSVILAGVYDIQNIKRKIRPEDEHVHNSPWNIAAKFDVDMSFSVEDISGMLSDYEKDKSTGMKIKEVATEIRAYTGGYPVLVCRICQILDKELAGSEDFPTLASAWTKYGVIEAVKRILNENSPLFDSLMAKIEQYPQLNEMLQNILFNGDAISYQPDNDAVKLAAMFGFIKSNTNKIQIANRIFETRLYNKYIFDENAKQTAISKEAQIYRNKFVTVKELNMDLILEKFVESYDTIYGDQTEKFLEKDGRRLFLLFIRPIINGIGNYYVEAETRDYNRTDVIIDYKAKQYILEMKIWRGNSYNERGEEQLTDYLEYYHVNKGWMLSFSFNQNKHVGITHHNINGKEITEAVV